MRLSPQGQVEEYYAVSGSDRFEKSRSCFYSAFDFNGIIFVYDTADPSSRASVSRVWVPELMQVFGDVKAVEASGRHASAGPHVRVNGAFNELKALWLHARSSHAGLRVVDAVHEGVRLSSRLLKLILNKYYIWSDAGIDLNAERELLATSSIPALVVGVRRGFDDHEAFDVEENVKLPYSVIASAGDVSANTGLSSFLQGLASTSTRGTGAATRIEAPSANEHVSYRF